MQAPLPTSIFHTSLADPIICTEPLSMQMAEKVFTFFKNAPLFRWSDANNDCEDRANAICILLHQWKISNAKAWVFSGSFLGEAEGYLTNTWNYHVAASIPVAINENVVWYVIDPATSNTLVTVENWALAITQTGSSYHFIKEGAWYIFPACAIQNDNWHKRDRRNFNWTMQGLSGINGASVKGRAQLAFHKSKVKDTVARFRKMMSDGLN